MNIESASFRLRSLILISLLTLGLLAVLILPGSAVRAAADPYTGTTIYYDSPAEGNGEPAPYVVGARWDKPEVTYSFVNCPRAIDCGQAWQALRESVEAWDAVCGLTLTEVPSGGDIAMGFFVGEHGDGEPFDGPGNVLAHAFYPVAYLGDLAGDVHFDDSESWYTGGSGGGRIHLKTVAMHEAGHALGLGHSQDSGALMWASYEGERGLGADDIAGIQSIYGPPNENDGGSAPPTNPSSVTATATTTVRVRSGPGTGFPQVGSVDAGATVPVLGKNAAGDWLYVESKGVRGWAAAFLFTINGDLNTVPVVSDDGGGAVPPPTAPPPGPTPEPTELPPSNPSDVTGVALNTVRVRVGPGIGYPTIATIDIGTTVNIIGRKADSTWIYIRYQNIEGWVATWLFRIIGDLNTVPVKEVQFYEGLRVSAAR